MREIKFRGKRIDNGEWVYGSLTNYSQYMSYITVDLLEQEVYKVYTETVGQYTGLKDKNGVEIYEGDILEYDFYHLPLTIKYQDNGFWSCEKDISTMPKKEYCSVIDNIYDKKK